MGAGYSIRARGESSAEIYLYEDVGESFFGGVSAKQFADDLKGLGGVQQIDLRINSYGGEVFDGFAIYRQLVDHPAKIISHIDGVAASIASVIAMAGDEIHIAEAGFFMIHNAQGLAMGDAGTMRQMADTLETITATIADVYVGRTTAALDEVRGWMDAETWMTAAEALDRGFADQMVENMRLAAHVDISRHKFNQLPEALRGAVVTAPAIPTPEAVTVPNLSAAKASVQRMQARLTLAAPRGQAA